MTLAIIFPGQGSQYVGMGSDIAHLPKAKEIFAQANDILHFDLTRLCYEGPLETLCRTDVSQVAILTHSIAVLECYAELHPEIKSSAVATCGLSLGEYTAAVLAEALTFAEALPLVQLRGQAMQRACDIRPGGMLAVMGLSEQDIIRIIDPPQREYLINIANINAPDQIVISGAKNLLDEAAVNLKKAGARVIPLKVAGAFHSLLMKPAEEELSQELHKSNFRPPRIPIVSNVDAQYMTSREAICLSLKKQLISPVRWLDSIKLLAQNGVDIFYEIGPGNQLTGLLKRTVQNVKGIAIGKLENLTT